MDDFYEKFINLCANKRVSPSKAAQENGFSRTAPNGWKNGKQPNDHTIRILEKYFGVPNGYFYGEDSAFESAPLMGAEINNLFYKKFIEICAAKKISPSKAANDIGLSSAAATGWKYGKRPNDITIKLLADYFNTSVDYFLKDKLEEALSNAETEETDALNMQEAVRNLTTEQLHDLIDMANKRLKELNL